MHQPIDISPSPISSGDSPYCSTCTSCGDYGCCSPWACVKVRCKYGQGAIEAYEKAIEKRKRYYDILVALGFFSPDALTIEDAKKISRRGSCKLRRIVRKWEIQFSKACGAGWARIKNNNNSRLYHFLYSKSWGEIVTVPRVYSTEDEMLKSEDHYGHSCECDQGDNHQMMEFVAEGNTWEALVCLNCLFLYDGNDCWSGVNIREEGESADD